MDDENLEKIIGTPRMNNCIANRALTETINSAVMVYLDGFQSKTNYVNFSIDSSNSKAYKGMHSACSLSRTIEAYGSYTKGNNTIKIETLIVKY
ncbi:MAG: hypothetical protein WC376_04115 [Candidatus Nanoarchaeia archaeon]|jgi:hypothetical protein